MPCSEILSVDVFNKKKSHIISSEYVSVMKIILGLNIFHWNVNTFNSGRNMQVGGVLKTFSVREHVFVSKWWAVPSPSPRRLWLLFFHIKFHIPGSWPAFVSSVYQVQELLELFFPIGKSFSYPSSNKKPPKTTKISLLCLVPSFSFKLYRQFVHICS